jgi:hypothetical protein
MDKYFEDRRIKEKYEELPDLVRNIIDEFDWQDAIRKISDLNNLRIDQGALLEREVVYIFLGIDDEEHFKDNLIKEAQLNEQQADKVTADVSKNVFDPILSKIENKTNEPEADFEEVTPQIPPIQPKAEESPKEEPPEESSIISDSLSSPTETKPQKIDPYRELVD